MMRVSILQIFPQTPPFSLSSRTLTHSVFTAAGRLSAVFTHITGWKEVDFTMRCSGSWQLVSTCRQNPEPTALCDVPWWNIRCWSPQRLNSQRIHSSGLKLPAHLKLYLFYITCHHCVKSIKLKLHHKPICKSKRFTVFICFPHKRPFYDTLQYHKSNQCIHRSIL